jgi:hypothetical protein
LPSNHIAGGIRPVRGAPEWRSIVPFVVAIPQSRRQYGNLTSWFVHATIENRQ